MSVRKNAEALVASDLLEEIILERYLSGVMPQENKLCLKEIYIYTGYNYYNMRNYINSNLFTISKDAIYISGDMQLLSCKSKEYVEGLIKKMICPKKYENDKYVYIIAKLFDHLYFSEEEQKFIEFMTNELYLIIKDRAVLHRISFKDLVGFHNLNRRPFLHIAQRVYNDILQKKICVGDNIMEYINKHLTENEIIEKLKNASKYDYFFDSNGNLKCDLNTNTDILIKNFLSTIIYRFNDDLAKTILLLKLNNKYSFLISEKFFYEHD